MATLDQDIARTLEAVRLAGENVISLRRQLEADRPRHRNLLSRSRELVAQSEDLLAKASARGVTRAPPYLLYEHLAIAERHVNEGFAIIARQREIVAALERGGHETREAVELLDSFEDIQHMHIADRDRLRRQLGVI